MSKPFKVQVIEKARALIEDERHWCHGELARDMREVPVDGFWSVSVYDEKGYFEPNAPNAYSLNNVTAKNSVCHY